MINRVVLLNIGIITTPGRFVYKAISLQKAIQIIKSCKKSRIKILSVIGHKSTAQTLTKLLSIKVGVNRINYIQRPSDKCIVFKLNRRREEEKILTKSDIKRIGYTFGLLTMKKE